MPSEFLAFQLEISKELFVNWLTKFKVCEADTNKFPMSTRQQKKKTEPFT